MQITKTKYPVSNDNIITICVTYGILFEIYSFTGVLIIVEQRRKKNYENREVVLVILVFSGNGVHKCI